MVAMVYTATDSVLCSIMYPSLQGNGLLSVIGAVGAGKVTIISHSTAVFLMYFFSQSTLLHCLLGELKPMDGLVAVSGSVSYASQEAWVFSGTVRENILFGLPYKRSLFNTVLEACTLDKVHVHS